MFMKQDRGTWDAPTGQPKVAKAGCVGAIEEDVGALDVTMQLTQAVQVSQPARHVPQHLHPACQAQRRPPSRLTKPVRKGATLCERVHKAWCQAVDAVPDELQNARVLGGSQHPHLGCELLVGFDVARPGELGPFQPFNRHCRVPVEARVDAAK